MTNQYCIKMWATQGAPHDNEYYNTYVAHEDDEHGDILEVLNTAPIGGSSNLEPSVMAIKRTVKAESPYMAIAKFREWQSTGKSESFLTS